MSRIKIFFLALLMSAALQQTQAQHYLGVRAGYGSGSVRLYPKEETGMVWGLYSGGVSYKYYSDVKYVGAIEVDMQLLQQGFKWHKIDPRTPNDTTTTYSRSINSIEMPIIWQPHFYLFNQSVRFFINLGLTLSYNINSHYKWESEWDGLLEAHKYDMQLPRDNRWGYGLCGGAGLSVFMRRFEVAVEGRYYFGYSDILRNKNKYEGNPIRSPLDNINVSMALYYRLSKEGIRSAPGKRLADKIKKKELEQVLEDSAPKREKEKIKIKEEPKNGDDKTAESSQTDTEGH